MEQDSKGIYWLGGAVAVAIIAAFVYFAFADEFAPSAAETSQEAEAADTDTGAVATAGSDSGTKGKLPVVKTTGFASVSSTTAVVVGSVVPLGASATYWFEYGTSTSFGSIVDARSVGAGALEVGASGVLVGLKPGTEYYFRLAAQNAYGRAYGSVYKLITTSK